MNVGHMMPRLSMEEHAALGEAIYDRELRGAVETGNMGKYILIDVETGDYEIDESELAASDRMLARRPDAQVWLRRVGSRYARRIGSRPAPEGR